MPPRRHTRNRISSEVKERLVRAFEEPSEDYLAVAATLGVHRSTARSIVARYIRERRVADLPRGGRNNVKVDDDMRQCLVDIVDEDCTLTLHAINQELKRRLPRKPQIHDRTVGRALDGMLVSLKLTRRLPADRNRPDVINSRFEYANWFLNTGVIGHCIFIDECGYNIWTARSYGRATQGERAYRQVCGQRGRNVTCILAVSPRTGLVHHSAEIGGMNAQGFANFLNATYQRLPANGNIYFIYDNAPAHRNANNPGPNCELKPLPPYSPFLNIVEEAISSFKAAIKAHLSQPAQQRMMNNRNEARRQGIPLGEWRKQLLLRAATRNVNAITPQKAVQWYNRMQTYLPRCLNREHIQG